MDFGKRLREVLKAKGITQKELARKIETTPQNINQYITNRRTPKPCQIKRIANTLGVSEDVFIDTGRPCWIPIGVKFPKHEQIVLVSVQGFSDTKLAVYREDAEGGAFYLPFGNKSYSECNAFVTAWMPIPEPYKPEKDTEVASWKDKVLDDFMKGVDRCFDES